MARGAENERGNPGSPTSDLTERRRLFSASVSMLGWSMGDAAQRVGCTYNHLLLVLDGVRRPSARLNTAINDVIREAKPMLLASLANVEL